MKLLFDENLSPKLPRLMAKLFPGSMHARDCGLLGRSDEDVWEYARAHSFTIVSKDSDFRQRSLLYGRHFLKIASATFNLQEKLARTGLLPRRIDFPDALV